MTVETQASKVQANGNGAATVFSFSPVVIFDTTDIEVVLTDTLTGIDTPLTEGTGANAYSVIPASGSYPSAQGVTGSIQYPEDQVTPILSTDRLTIKRVLVLEQAVDLENQGGYFPDVQETALDKSTMVDIQLDEDLQRSLRGPVSDLAAIGEMPNATDRADMALAFDSSGDPVVVAKATTVDPSPLTTKGDVYIYNIDDTRLPVGGTGALMTVSAGLPTWLAVGTNGYFLTVSGGTPTWVADTSLQDVLTTAGDLLYENVGEQRLGIGSAGQVLTTTGGLPAWETPSWIDDVLTTNGDIIIENTGEQRLGVGTNGQVLTITAGLPAWENAAASSPTTTQGDIIFRGVSADERLAIGTANQVLQVVGGVPTWQTSSGGGDVVDDTTPQLGGNLDVNGFAITSVGVTDITLTSSASGNIVLDGLNFPTADGSANQVIKTDGVGNLGFVTPFSSPTTSQGDMIYNTGLSDERLAIGSAGQVLTVSAMNPVWVTPTVYTADVMTTQGDIIYENSGEQRLAIGTTNQVLAVSAGGIPEWQTNTPSSPLTTNGDIMYYNAGDARLPVGTNGQVLTVTAGQPAWAAAGGGGGGSAPEFTFSVPALEAVETNFAPVEKISGTNVSTLVCAFDDTTEEYRNGSISAPGDIDTSGTVTFRAYVRAKTGAASRNVELRFGHLPLNDGEAEDQAYTNEDSGDKAIDATTGDYTEITWTETVTNLGWSANDMVFFRISRIAASANDLVGDMYWRSFTIEIPVA